jgi:hypothetical protein
LTFYVIFTYLSLFGYAAQQLHNLRGGAGQTLF